MGHVAVSADGPVVAIVPAYEVADLVAATVERLVATGRLDRIVVVDDASADGSGDVARRAGAEVVTASRNGGKGSAVALGVTAAPDAGSYLLVDADLGATAGATVELLDHVGPNQVVIGVPVAAAGRGGFGLVRDLAAGGIAAATGWRPRAPLSGQRAVPGPVLRDLVLAPRFALETAMTIDLWHRGVVVVEVDVEVDHRHHGRTLAGLAHRGGQGVDVIGALVARLGVARTAHVAASVLLARAVATFGARGGRV